MTRRRDMCVRVIQDGDLVKVKPPKVLNGISSPVVLKPGSICSERIDKAIDIVQADSMALLGRFVGIVHL